MKRPSNHDPNNVATLESLFIGPLRLLWSSRVPFLVVLKIVLKVSSPLLSLLSP